MNKERRFLLHSFNSLLTSSLTPSFFSPSTHIVRNTPKTYQKDNNLRDKVNISRQNELFSAFWVIVTNKNAYLCSQLIEIRTENTLIYYDGEN